MIVEGYIENEGDLRSCDSDVYSSVRQYLKVKRKEETGRPAYISGVCGGWMNSSLYVFFVFFFLPSLLLNIL